MKLRNASLLAALTTAFTVPYVIRASQADQPPPQHSPRARSDAPYHSTDMSKPDGTGSSLKAKKLTTPVADHSSYPPAALTKIEILPSSISIAGPRYSQLLVVEGTFADGHQEDLTSQAKFTTSDAKVASLDSAG